jgi:hypothetical protein
MAWRPVLRKQSWRRPEHLLPRKERGRPHRSAGAVGRRTQASRRSVVGQGGMMLDSVHLRPVGQRLRQVTAPAGRVVSGAVSPHAGPVQHRLDAMNGQVTALHALEQPSAGPCSTAAASTAGRGKRNPGMTGRVPSGASSRDRTAARDDPARPSAIGLLRRATRRGRSARSRLPAPSATRLRPPTDAATRSSDAEP